MLIIRTARLDKTVIMGIPPEMRDCSIKLNDAQMLLTLAYLFIHNFQLLSA